MICNHWHPSDCVRHSTDCTGLKASPMEGHRKVKSHSVLSFINQIPNVDTYLCTHWNKINISSVLSWQQLWLQAINVAVLWDACTSQLHVIILYSYMIHDAVYIATWFMLYKNQLLLEMLLLIYMLCVYRLNPWCLSDVTFMYFQFTQAQQPVYEWACQ